MTVDFSSNLKVYSALSVSYAAVGYGFVFMSFPVGLPLKIAGSRWKSSGVMQLAASIMQ